MENKKVRKHSLCEKNAVIAMILTVPLGLLTQLSGQPQGVVISPDQMTVIRAGPAEI